MPRSRFRAWLTAGSDKELRYLQAPKRAAALQLASLAGQAQHIRDQYPELARQVEHENKSRRRP